MRDIDAGPRVGEPLRPTRVFISYSRKDREFAEGLVKELTAAGYEAYLDTKDIAAGEAWQDRLRSLIVAADCVVFVISPNSVASAICKWEVEETINQEKRLLPVVYRQTDVDLLPARLARLHFISCLLSGPGAIDSEKLEKAVDALIEAIDIDIGWIREHTRLGELARRWDDLGRPKHDVLRGASLIEAEYWITHRPAKASAPSDLHLDFVRASREVENEILREEKARVDALYVMQSRFLSDLALQYVKGGDALTGALLAIEALPDPETGVERPLVQEARQALHVALWERREERLFTSNGQSVQNAVFSPDGNILVTVGWDPRAHIWDRSTGKIRHALEGHTGNVEDAAFSPDGSVIVTAAEDATARIWETSTGRCLFVVNLHDKYPRRVIFSPVDKRFIVAFNSNSEQLFDAETGLEIGILGDSTWARASEGIAAFSPDGRWIVTPQSSMHSGFVFYDARTRREVLTIVTIRGKTQDADLKPDHSGNVTCLAWSPDGQYLVSASEDHTCRVWQKIDSISPDDPVIMPVLATVLEGHSDSVGSAVFSPNGRKLATASDDHTVRVWDFWRGGAGFAEAPLLSQAQLVLKAPPDSVTRYAAFSPDSSKLVTVAGTFYGEDRLVQVWDAETGEAVTQFQGHLGNVHRAQFALDSSALLTASGDGTARIINLKRSGDLQTLSAAVDRDISGLEQISLVCGAFSPSGDRVAAGSYQGPIVVWDVSRGEFVVTAAGHDGPVRQVKFDASGEQLLSWGDDMVVRVWNARTGTAIAVLGTPTSSENYVKDFLVTADGSRVLFVPEPDVACIWDLCAQQPRAELRSQSPISSARFTPDEKLIVTGHADGKARLWESATGTLVRALDAKGKDVLSVQWSADGTKFLTSSSGGSACIWETATWGLLTSFGEGYESRGTDRAILSPDGTRAVTYGGYVGPDVWDTTTGRKLMTMRRGNEQITQIAFSADGQLLLTGDGAPRGRAAWLWDVRSGDLIIELNDHLRWIVDVDFHPQGAHALTVSDDGTARIWRIFSEVKPLIDYAKHVIPRGLTPWQRRKAYLPEETPAWLIDTRKWPYETDEWKHWLSDKRTGGMRPPPNLDERWRER